MPSALGTVDKTAVFDAKDFLLGLKKADKYMLELAAYGLFEAFTEALRDAKTEEPFVPRDIGNLEGSATVDEKWAVIKGHRIEIHGGFNCEYAAKWHELDPSKAAKINWTKPGSGPKFLQAKLIRNRNRYIEIIARRMQRGR